MRQTGLPWLGDVPAHWNVRRIKTLLTEVDSRTKTGKERLLSLRMRQGLVDHIDAGGKLIPAASLVNFKIIKPGQVVMNRMRAAAGLFGVADVRGLVSPDYAVFEPKPDAFNPYLLQAFRLPSLAAVFRAESKGLGTGESGFLRLYTDRFGPIPVPYPPLDEQRLIVRFLDWHGAQTAKLVRAKKKIIALLNEQKQAIIHRAVTSGLDPNAKLKPSGIPWLGDVPEGWEVKRLKNVCRINPAKLAIRRRAANELATFLPMERVSSDGKIDGSIQVPISELANGFTYFERGDVILAKITPCFENGKGAVLDALPTEVGFGSTEFIVLRASREVDPRFLYLLTFEAQFRRLGIESMTGSAGQQRISQEFVANYCIALPGREEQARIIEALKAATQEFDAVIDAAFREIALIQEYRTRLIADVVTGKLDVRAAAAGLPETIEPEPIDDLGAADDLDETLDDAETEEAAA